MKSERMCCEIPSDVKNRIARYYPIPNGIEYPME